jgi:hypothetical protein
MENKIPFTYSSENIEYSPNLSYLLNFWHTTKLNKENEFIKRNGVHPSLAAIQRREAVDFETIEGNSIQTNFYTVFRIFIENLFNKEIKTMKERNAEEWSVNFKPEVKGLDSKSYLLIYYAKTKNLLNDTFFFNNRIQRRVNVKPQISFVVKLKKKDQLHSKKILDSFQEYETTARENIDQDISVECGRLISKIEDHLNLFKNEIEKPKRKEAKQVISSQVRELLPFYNQLNSSISGMDSRIKFSFILNYARQVGNLAANQINNDEDNFQQFLALTNNTLNDVGTL